MGAPPARTVAGMGTDRGQASIEWVGAVLLLALALAALGRVAGRVEAEPLATALVGATTCAARDGCNERRELPARGRRASPAAARPAVSAPPLLPVAAPERARRGSSRTTRRLPPGAARPLPPSRARRSVGALWRRAWLLCFGYERARFGLLYPETGPRQTVPLSGVLQMVNDCVSPVDFARDWEHLRPR
jgi:hypothetical protein